jgi:conjugative relaxase-like TrwC/TraI family protein
MLTIAKLRRGNEDYVLRAVAAGAEDYYAGSGEAPGVWLGGGAESLGLAGEVGAEAFRAVLQGRDPASGNLLAKRKAQGFDLTFSAPKSVSVLWALAPDPVSRQVVAACHEEAIAAAMGWMESQASAVKRGAAGCETIGSSGFVAASYRHRTSRAGDPQLHSHVVVSNMALGDDGKWSALGDHRRLFLSARAAGHLYQSELRSLLTARLGVEWGPVANGCADIDGISRPLLDVFAKRSAEVEAAVIARGGDPRDVHATSVAALATRRPKPGHARLDWSADAGDYGVEPADTPSLHDRCSDEARRTAGLPDWSGVFRLAETPTPPDLAAEGDRLAGPEGLTEMQASVSRRDVIIAFASMLGMDARSAITAADEWLSRPDVRSLGRLRPRSEERWTTAELESEEASILLGARQRSAAGVGLADPEAAIAERPTLSAEQADMVRHLTTSGAGVEVVVGRAGTGKTFALDAARQAWEDAGLTVLGSALSAQAAGELSRGARVRATTIARQILDVYRDGLPAGCVLVIDEAGMADTRSLAKLGRAVAGAGGKLVLVGDHRQLPSIAAGGTFARLARSLGAVELTEVRRQASAADREALAEVRSGDLAAGVRGLLGRSGRTVVAADATTQRQAMVSDWSEARAAGQSALLLARRRSRVEDLATAARVARRDAGELGADELVIQITPEPAKRRAEQAWQPPSRTYATGDEVRFGRNTTMRWKHLAESMPGVHNGALGTVTAIDAEVSTITVRLAANDAEATAAWDAAHQAQAAEIDALLGEAADWQARAEAATTPADRATARRRERSARDKMDRRLHDRTAGVVTVDGRRTARPGREITVDAAYLAAGHVAYSYARSVHAAQGATADVVLVDGEDARGREAAYTALSRHRERVKVYLTSTLDHGPVEPHQSPPEAAPTPLDRFLDRSAPSHAQRSASELTGAEAVASRRRVRELATRPLADLTAERQALEAELARPAVPVAPDVEAAEAALAAAVQAAAAAPGDRQTERAVSLARRRLDASRTAAARASTLTADRSAWAGPDRDAHAALAELRQAEARAAAIAAEALTADGGGELGPRPERGAARRAWTAEAQRRAV